MANFEKNQSFDNFDWEAFEKGFLQTNKGKVYDSVSEFKQGIAIVTRNGKFGAIMVGNKEIVKPIYKELTEFENGYAKAKFPIAIDGDSENLERIINMSGQIAVKQGQKEVFLPEEFEWGSDFNGDICIVVKNSFYGVINNRFEYLYDCVYSSFTNFINGYAILRNDEGGIIIDTEAKLCYNIIKTFDDNTSIIRGNNGSESLGVINGKMKLIIPIIYQNLQRLDCGCFVADSKEGSKLFFDSTMGNIISKMTLDSVININENFFVAYKDNKTYLFSSPDSLLLTIPYNIKINTSNSCEVNFTLNGLKFACDLNGNLYKNGSLRWNDRLNNIPKRRICQAYLAYTHSYFTKNFEIIENEQHQKGLSDLDGNVVFPPQYNEIIPFTEDLFIVAKSSADAKTLIFGVVDSENVTKVSFDFKCLLPINNKYLAFTDDTTYTITKDNKYNKLDLPSFNSHYANIKFGIIDLDGNKLTTADYSTIVSPKDSNAFIIGKEFGKYSALKYGVINSDGCYILEPKYEKITYSEQENCFITNLSYSESGNYPYETKTNQVSINGFYLIQGNNDETVLVPTKIADWCDKFSEDGIALVIKDGHKGHINRAYQIVAFNDGKCIVIPECFDFSGDFMYGFAPVSKNNRYGIINTKLEQIFSCEYEYIEPLSAKRFKFKKDDQWGVVDSCGNIIIESKYRAIWRETETIIKVKTSVKNGSWTEDRYGLYNEDGNLIIQNLCKGIVSVEHETLIFFIITIDSKQGVYDDKGSSVIPPIYDRIELKEGCFMCHLECPSSYNYSQKRQIKLTNKYNLKGEQLLALNEKQTFVVPAEYDLAYPTINGLIIVIKDGKWGMINMQNDVIVEPQYSIIDSLDDSLARVGKSDEDSHIYFYDDWWHVKNIKYGLIDTTGEVVLPLEYKNIELWDNGYYYICKNATIRQILAPCLKLAIDLQGKGECKYFDNRYIMIKGTSGNYSSLIDFYGNEIIPEKEYNSFSEIEVLENGFLKVILHNDDYHRYSQIRIIDKRGKEIYNSDICKDISLLKNGSLLVEKFKYTSTDGSGRYVYNVVNLQGKELFEYSLNEIRLLEDGNFSIQGDNGWGFSNRKGNFIASPRYKNELKFENGFADISIAGETLKINSNGNILVKNGKESVLLPNIYYWGSNFKNDISIVRSITDAGDRIGVVNVRGEEIIPTIYKNVKLLSDRTILCREYDCYGLYDTKGKCILPVVFLEINHIAKNRIRVVWNLEIVKSWDKDQYEKGNSTYKSQGFGIEYEINQRAALCDSYGTILNDKQYLYVGKFTGKYARVYNEIKEENYTIILSQVGIIDLDGNTVVPPEYNRISLYNHSFAKLRKGKICGIANLTSKKITMFESLQIVRMWDLDEYGRCLYSTDWTYDKVDEKWIGTKGVLSFDGVIVPPKKYDRIILLENGLIKVYKDNTIGLLDKQGKELLPVKYSYISDFKGKYASICLGGQKEENYPYNITGGKWGMIDDGGNIVNKCVNDEELVIPSTENKPIVAEDTIEYYEPSVLLSDYIPEKKTSYWDDYFFDNYDDDYDNGYNKYGGYNGYDDNTIDEAFDGNPSLTWNCD